MLSRAAREVLSGAAAVVDHAVNYAALSRSGGQRESESFSHDERLALLGRLAERYGQMSVKQGFFREPRQVEPEPASRLREAGGLSVVDLSWSSDYAPLSLDVAERYGAYAENRTAHVRLVRHHETPRPLAVLVHGYLGGVHRMERRIWPLGYLHRLGMDVALFVLPFHGPRARPGGFGTFPPFPGADPRFTNEGFRQAMGDFRDFVGWALDRGHPSVGVMGMSLGGFTTALAATVEPRLSFAVPIIPLASFPDVIRHQGRLSTNAREAEAQHKALERVYEITSPLHRAPAVKPDHILVVGGERDRITPISHARKLAQHFACRIETWHGGHLVQLGRSAKFRSIGRFLSEIGVVNHALG